MIKIHGITPSVVVKKIAAAFLRFHQNSQLPYTKVEVQVNLLYFKVTFLYIKVRLLVLGRIGNLSSLYYF